MTRIISISINEELQRKLASKNLTESKEIIKFVRKMLNDVLEDRIDLNKLSEGLEKDKAYLLLFWKGKLFKKSIDNELILSHIEWDYDDKTEWLSDVLYDMKTMLEKS